MRAAEWEGEHIVAQRMGDGVVFLLKGQNLFPQH